jgi:hypothetical protein
MVLNPAQPKFSKHPAENKTCVYPPCRFEMPMASRPPDGYTILRDLIFYMNVVFYYRLFLS